MQIFKPQLDTRYSNDHVTSHSSLQLNAQNIEDPEQILTFLDDNTRIVGIDEAQFLSPSIVEISHRLANRGLRVLVAGLDLDTAESLLSHAAAHGHRGIVTKMSAICTVCGNPASRTQRIRIKTGANRTTKSSSGAEDLYEARCRKCFEPPQ